MAVEHGAQDYLLKDRLDAYLLPKVLRSMIERAANTEALFDEKERAQVTLNSIGDAVMSTDCNGDVTFLNLVAERLTGWSCKDAAGRPLEEVFQLIDGATRERVSDPMGRAIRENKTVGLTPNCILLRRDGFEAAIEDSAAPIHDRHGPSNGCRHGIPRRQRRPRALASHVLSGAARPPYRSIQQRVAERQTDAGDGHCEAGKHQAWAPISGCRSIQDHQ